MTLWKQYRKNEEAHDIKVCLRSYLDPLVFIQSKATLLYVFKKEVKQSRWETTYTHRRQFPVLWARIKLGTYDTFPVRERKKNDDKQLDTSHHVPKALVKWQPFDIL